MSDKQWFVLDVTAGMMQAEILKGFLEAQGIEVVLSQEGAGHSAFALNVGVLGEVELLVSEDDREKAQSLLDAYYQGTLETDLPLDEPDPPQG